MKNRFEMRFTGSGGQGVILASVIFAEAAIIDGMNGVQSQSYGPEARGGMCKAEAIISNSDILFSKVVRPNMLLALTQKALDQYASNVAEDATIIIDDSLTAPESLSGKRVVKLPILSAAKDRLGKAMTANIVAVGAINRTLKLFDDKVLTEAVRRHIPAGTEALNERALMIGRELAETADGSNMTA